MGRLIIDGNQVYELDEECLKQKKLEIKDVTPPTSKQSKQKKNKNEKEKKI